MIVIADAGGTNTSWRVLGDEISQLQTTGLNLLTGDISRYIADISSEIKPYQEAKSIYFYVAGAGLDIPKDTLFNEKLSQLFPQAKINLESDLLGAARSLFLDREGYVAILGSGTNFAFYDGQKVYKSVQSLGYIMGDEGSGSYMGKRLVSDYLRSKLPDDLRIRFQKRINMSDDELLQQVYGLDGRKFLASFSKFLLQNINHPYSYQLVTDSFHTFFKTFVQNEIKNNSISFSGSIAFYFSDILRQVGADLGFQIHNIVETPIAGLSLYHQKQ